MKRLTLGQQQALLDVGKEALEAGSSNPQLKLAVQKLEQGVVYEHRRLARRTGAEHPVRIQPTQLCDGSGCDGCLNCTSRGVVDSVREKL